MFDYKNKIVFLFSLFFLLYFLYTQWGILDEIHAKIKLDIFNDISSHNKVAYLWLSLQIISSESKIQHKH